MDGRLDGLRSAGDAVTAELDDIRKSVGADDVVDCDFLHVEVWVNKGELRAPDEEVIYWR